MTFISINQSSDRNRYAQIRSIGTSFIRAASKPARLSSKMRTMLKIQKTATIFTSIKNNTTAAAAVTAIRAPHRHKLLSIKRTSAASSLTALYKYTSFIYKISAHKTIPLFLICEYSAKPNQLNVLHSTKGGKFVKNAFFPFSILR